MASKCRVETNTRGYGNEINSVTDASMEGDSPHSEFIAGVTAAGIARGHSEGHANYLASVKVAEIYTGKSAGGGSSKGDSGGMGDIKDMMGFLKGILG